MTPTRRRVLRATGIGVASTAFARSGRLVSAASDRERVFVHPEASLVGSAIDVVDPIGGEILLEYENFEFVVASVPSDRVDELADASGVALVERDRPIELERSVDDLLDGVVDDDGIDIGLGGGDDDDRSCTGHPPQEPSWGYERIGAAGADGTGDGVDVAILDTGIDAGHCDLEVAGGRNFTADGRSDDYADRHGHGTHCAGIVGALDTDAGVVGVAPGVNLYAVKVLDDDGRGFQSWMAAGVDWCLSNGIELLSMSFGSESGSATMDAALERAAAEGHLLVGSAGNEGNAGAGSCDEETLTYPATHEDVIAVVATERDDSLASYSSVGSAVELAAPGSEIRSTTVDGYAVRSGTSMACPHVTGVAALVWERTGERGPGGASVTVRRTLRETADPVLETCEEGYGLVDAVAATGSDGRGSDGDGIDGSDDSDVDDRDSVDEDSSEGNRDGTTDGTAGGNGSSNGDGNVDAVENELESWWDRGVAAVESFLDALVALFGR